MFIYPTGTKNITSPYRPPHRPTHNGIDFADGKVHDIWSSAEGKVARSYVSSSFGEVVYIDHVIKGISYQTIYAHMVSGSRTVTVGDNVSQGQKVGVMGNTGQSRGLHLHFELLVNGVHVNPLPYLTGEGGGTGDLPPPVCSNEALSMAEMTINAQYIAFVLVNDGWSPEAIAGMLGNMQTESTINPCRWQSGISYDDTPYIIVPRQGYGLVQWTPFSNYTRWARDESIPYDDMDSQLARINYEVDNGLQWIKLPAHPITFKEFKVSTESPEYLAQAFILNYERPADQNQPLRSTQARYWYDLLDWSGQDMGGGQSGEGEYETNLIKMLLSGALNGW